MSNGHQHGTNEFRPGSCGEFRKCRSVPSWECLPVFDESACPIQAVEPQVQLVQSQVVYSPLGPLPGFVRQPRQWDNLSGSGIVVKKAFWLVLFTGSARVHVARVWPFAPLVVMIAPVAAENPVGPLVSQLGESGSAVGSDRQWASFHFLQCREGNVAHNTSSCRLSDRPEAP